MKKGFCHKKKPSLLDFYRPFGKFFQSLFQKLKVHDLKFFWTHNFQLKLHHSKWSVWDLSEIRWPKRCQLWKKWSSTWFKDWVWVAWGIFCWFWWGRVFQFWKRFFQQKTVQRSKFCRFEGQGKNIHIFNAKSIAIEQARQGLCDHLSCRNKF